MYIYFLYYLFYCSITFLIILYSFNTFFNVCIDLSKIFSKYPLEPARVPLGLHIPPSWESLRKVGEAETVKAKKSEGK